MATIVVGPGQTSSTLIESGDVEFVQSGGVATSTQVFAGGELLIQGGGLGSGLLEDGGFLSANNGAVVGDTVENGATLIADAFSVAENVAVGAGSVFLLSGSSVAVGAQAAGGQIQVVDGSVISGSVALDGGSIVVASATASDIIVGSAGVLSLNDAATVSGVTLAPGGVAIVTSGASVSDVTVSAGGLLYVSSGATNPVGTTVVSGGTIDLQSVAFSGNVVGTLDAATDVLTVAEGGTTDTLQLSGTYTGETFQLSADVNGDTVVTVVCFCRGTLIETDAGEVAVEKLREGDGVVTLAGAVRPVRWIGRRRKTIAAGDPDADELLPIRIEAGALGESLPRRTLRVSPQHCVFVDDVLVPARYLVNGRTITQESVDRVEYFHVELDSHDVILAEGAAAETYLDTGNRSMFSNAPLVALRPDLSEDLDRKAASPCLCAPLVMGGAHLDAIRARLDAVVVEEVAVSSEQRSAG